MNVCFCCGGLNRRPRQYLCRSCWYQLPPLTRLRLNERSDQGKARDRLFKLLSAIRHGIPIDEIEVTA